MAQPHTFADRERAEECIGLAENNEHYKATFLSLPVTIPEMMAEITIWPAKNKQSKLVF